LKNLQRKWGTKCEEVLRPGWAYAIRIGITASANTLYGSNTFALAFGLL
jgi:hypothetical protein